MNAQQFWQMWTMNLVGSALATFLGVSLALGVWTWLFHFVHVGG